MNLKTTYLGLELANPLMAGASPMVGRLDMVRRLADAGASAIVMHSLFAEQIEGTIRAVTHHARRWEDNFSEAASFLPNVDDFALGPQEYLDHLAAIKRTTGLPVIASLNGTHLGSWVDYARLLEQAGADALELNTYFLATACEDSGAAIEERVVELAGAIRATVRLPVAVKLSPFYTSVAHLTRRLEQTGVNGVVLFNRFFQPEIDVENLEVVPKLELSTPEDLRLRLRWLGLLRDQTSISLACSGGVHTAADVVKALLAGADVVQVVALLLHLGPERLGHLLRGLTEWMEEREYGSVAHLRGALSYRRCSDPEAYERGNYLRTLQLWKE